MNPWLVESVHSFLYLKCPECVFDTKYENEEIFQYHALDNHPWSNVLFGDTVKVDPISIENQILKSIKIENHDEYETYDYRYNSEITPEISISNPVSELKVEFSKEGDENKVFVKEGQYTAQEKEQLKGSGFNKLEHLFNFQALEKKHGPFKRENGLIFCSQCPRNYDRPARLNEHIVAAHEGKKPYSCTLCEKSFGLKRNLRTHLDKIHNAIFPDQKRFQEKEQLKGSGFNKIEHLVSFQALEEKHGPFKKENGLIFCSHCSKSFDRPARLSEHIVAAHEGKKPYSCTLCEKSYGMKCNLRTHIENAHGPKKVTPVVLQTERVKCNSCEKDFVNKFVLKNHVQIVHEKKKRFQCTACDYSAFDNKNIKRHFESMHEKKKHNCPHCDAVYAQKDTLNNHIKEYHPHHEDISQNVSNGIKKEEFDNKIYLTKPFQCLNCPESFVSKYDLNIHNKSAHAGAGLFKCSECDYSCNRRNNLHAHRHYKHKKKNSTKSLPCILCDKEFTDLPSFKEHINSVHEGKKPHKCSLCDQSYFLKSSLQGHVARIHEGYQARKTEYPCKICNSIFDTKYKLARHNVKEHDEKMPYLCTLCGEGFLVLKTLEQHTASVHEGVRYDCTLCDSNFATPGGLKRHIEHVHEQRKPHLCTICGIGSKTPQALKHHMRYKHTGEKPHMCSICGTSFHVTGSLAHHIRVVHEKEKRFSCPEESCDYMASTKTVLKEHLQRHTGIKPFGCPLCDTKFYRKTEQKQHFAAVHDKVRPINCLYCPKTFSRKYHLKTHLKSHNIIS